MASALRQMHQKKMSDCCDNLTFYKNLSFKDYSSESSAGGASKPWIGAA